MKRILPLALALAFCLSGCGSQSGAMPTATPTPVPTPLPTPTSEPRALQSTWLEVDETHRFWVELQKTDEPSPITETFIDNGSTYDGLRVNIYAGQDEPEPIQSFLTGYNCYPRFLKFSIGDWNFDGYNDLAFINAKNYRCRTCDFYIWDPDTRQLVHDPYGLGDLNYPELHPESQVVTSLFPISGGSELYRHYRYEDGQLTLTRECQKLLNFESETYSYSVEGLMNGSWKTLFQGEGDPDGITGRASEYLEWRDQFDYPPTLWGFPIDYTHDAFEVDTKGKLGTVLVTVETETADAEKYQFSVWTQDDLNKPLQTMWAEGFGVFHWKEVVDANFDGHTDFGYMYAMGNQPCYWHYWIWNEAKGRFIQEPEFDQISWPEFDEETGIISGYARNGYAGAAGVHTFHQWIDGRLVCIRRIETWPYGEDTLNEIRLTVEEPVDGVLTEIFRHETDIGTAFEEVETWRDLNYHG